MGKLYRKHPKRISPLYTIKLAVNALTCLAFVCGGISVLLAPVRELTTPRLFLDARSATFYGCSLLLLALMPFVTLMIWLNAHRDIHKPMAKQVRWELMWITHGGHKRESMPASFRSSSCSSLRSTRSLRDDYSLHSLPLSGLRSEGEAPSMEDQEALYAAEVEGIKGTLTRNPIAHWDGRGMESLLNAIPHVGKLKCKFTSLPIMFLKIYLCFDCVIFFFRSITDVTDTANASKPTILIDNEVRTIFARFMKILHPSVMVAIPD